MYKVINPFYSGGRMWQPGEQFEHHRSAAAWLKAGLIIEVKTVKPKATKAASNDGKRKPATTRKRKKQSD